jgi:hypothetical protein
MAYVYRHIRLDKNEPFYIGIGGDSNYKRAYTKKGRNDFWNRIVNKTDYEVEILIDGLSWEQACEKEKEFIKLYGRKDLKSGTLSNLTDGGDGIQNISIEVRKKMSLKNKGNKNALGCYVSEEKRKKTSMMMKGHKYNLGRKHSEESKKKMSELKINMSQETKDKISKAQLGKKISDETKIKMSEAKIGKLKSEETKLKMSEAKKRYWENRKNK